MEIVGRSTAEKQQLSRIFSNVEAITGNLKKSNDEGTEFYYMGDLTPIEESFEQTLNRMRDIAGIKEAKKPDFLDMDKESVSCLVFSSISLRAISSLIFNSAS